MAKRKIAVITTTRAEYGLQYWLLHDLAHDPDVELQLIVSGTHLSAEYGNTQKAIEDDGLPIAARVDMGIAGDAPLDIAQSVAAALIGFTQALNRLRPDVLVLLGDRYELLAAAQAAMVCGVPLAHIHGGEATEGAMDDQIRHALTKLAHLHFTAAEPYSRRIIQMGEDPRHVFCVGAPGLDFIERMQFLERTDLEADLGFELGERYFLATYHPVTLETHDYAHLMQEFFRALDSFPESRVIITRPNADPGNLAIAKALREYAASNPGRIHLCDSLGQRRYINAMKFAGAVIGNSSSGIIEAPYLGTPTVNIGARQKGRLRAASIIDCSQDCDSITKAIHKALSPEFMQAIAGYKLAYVAGASPKIRNHLKCADLSHILSKPFRDLALSAEANPGQKSTLSIVP